MIVEFLFQQENTRRSIATVGKPSYLAESKPQGHLLYNPSITANTSVSACLFPLLLPTHPPVETTPKVNDF